MTYFPIVPSPSYDTILVIRKLIVSQGEKIMAITAITRDFNSVPNIVRVIAANTLAEVATAGYVAAQQATIDALNSGAWEWLESDLILISASDGHQLFEFDGDDFDSFIQLPGGNGEVTLPVVDGDFVVFDGTLGALKDAGYSASDAAKTRVVMAGSAVQVGYMAKFVDTAGTVDDTAGAVINAGNIQAGLSGTAGNLISFPSTAATGSLILAAVANSGNTNVTISNALHGQASVYSIPDSGASTANFIISKLTGTQHITVGNLQVDAGNITAGISGTAGTLISFPGTAANGTLILAAANAGGAFNTTISNGSMGQSTVYTLPDILASTGGIVVSTAAVRMKSVAGAAAAGGAAAQSFTDTFCTTGSNVVGNWNTQANAVSVLKIVPGNGSFVVTSSGDAGVGTFNYVIMK